MSDGIRIRSTSLVAVAMAVVLFTTTPGYSQTAHVATEPMTVAQSLKALATAPRWEGGLSTNRSSVPTKRDAVHDLFFACTQAMCVLTRSKAAVDGDLLALARPNQPLMVRARAVRVLAMRGNGAVVPVLLRMATSDDPLDRCCAWMTYNGALANRTLPRPADVASAVDQYRKEKDEDVRQEMELFFGHAKADGALVPLLDRLKKERTSTSIIWALGEIGNPLAVPVLIETFTKASNPHCMMEALGKLATPQAADFIIDHLTLQGAVDALCSCKCPKALPTLQEHLRWQVAAGSGDVNVTRIAIIRLSEAEPAGALLGIATNANEDERTRFLSLRALLDYDVSAMMPQIIRIYRSDECTNIKRACIWLMKSSTLKEVSDAMMDHALAWKPKSMDDLATGDYLLDALNNRLDTCFTEMDDMKTHVERLRAGEKARND